MGRTVKLIENKDVFFSDIVHGYINKEDKELIGVTSLLKMYGLGADYAGIPEATLEKAAERGSAVHKAIEDWCKGKPFSYDGEYFDEVVNDLEAFKHLELPVLANEYLVSDNTHIASSIDIVLKDLTLVDIKTTSRIHYDAVAWQLSIYKWLFELQNPRKKVAGLKVLHLRGGKAKYEDVQEIPREQVLGLVAAYKDGADWARPTMEALMQSDQERALQALKVLEEKATAIKSELKSIEDEKKKLNEILLVFMREQNLVKWDINPNFSLTRVLAYDKYSVDSKRLQEEQPELYEKYKKTTRVAEQIRISIKQD